MIVASVCMATEMACMSREAKDPVVQADAKRGETHIDTAPSIATPAPEPVRPKVTTETTWSEIVAIPQFKGFGQYILARERIGYKPHMKLADVAKTLPFHRNVDANQSDELMRQMLGRIELPIALTK